MFIVTLFYLRIDCVTEMFILCEEKAFIKVDGSFVAQGE